MPAAPRGRSGADKRPGRSEGDAGERLYFGRQGLRLAASIFVFFGIVVFAGAPFVLGRFRLLIALLIGVFGVMNLVVARGLWKLAPWLRHAYLVWAATAVTLHVTYQLTRPFLAWGVFALSEVVFVVILVQIGRYLDHDVSRLQTKKSG